MSKIQNETKSSRFRISIISQKKTLTPKFQEILYRDQRYKMNRNVVELGEPKPNHNYNNNDITLTREMIIKRDYEL